MSMSEQPIGLFDSGLGGTSIWREIVERMPDERTIYLADSANAPYGLRSKTRIRELAVKNTEYLLAQNCKIIVVACNTATTNAISFLRERFDLPFIGIEPAIKPAALGTKTKKVGVLATKGTLSSELFHRTATTHAAEIEIIEQEGTGLVELIEAGQWASEKTKVLLESYVRPMVENGIDTLVLGCTHYPYLIPLLQKLLPPSVRIIDSGSAVAKQTQNVLQRHDLLSPPRSQGGDRHRLYTNSVIEPLKALVSDQEVHVGFLEF